MFVGFLYVPLSSELLKLEPAIILGPPIIVEASSDDYFRVVYGG
jgi:hypothetical protein